MPTSGDVVDVDLGTPAWHKAGLRHPAVLMTTQRILNASPSVVHVVPLTATVRRFHSEVVIAPDRANGLDALSAAQCQHLRSVSTRRIVASCGNVGPAVLAQLRETTAVILGLP
jgi:mRNA interferase MazF